ncbi:hypothetical protein, partial [Acetobacter musti]|uniref:hypothetical protein n=1 Tax=Acetobacter musti TaxID=864732 RepID=UPI001A7EA369
LELCRIPFPRNLAHKTRPRSGQMIAYRPVRKMGTTSDNEDFRAETCSGNLVHFRLMPGQRLDSVEMPP